jgi:hypothetical protein
LFEVVVQGALFIQVLTLLALDVTHV